MSENEKQNETKDEDALKVLKIKSKIKAGAPVKPLYGIKPQPLYGIKPQ